MNTLVALRLQGDLAGQTISLRLHHYARWLTGCVDFYDHRLQRHMRQAFYATDVTVVMQPRTLMCFDALLVASSGCSPEVCK